MSLLTIKTHLLKFYHNTLRRYEQITSNC